MEFTEAVYNFLNTGGVILYAILVVAMIMMTLIIERYLFLKVTYPGKKDKIQNAWQQIEDKQVFAAKHIRRMLLSKADNDLKASLPLIKSLIAVCPLFGLLGTVTGMIEVFDVMAFLGTGNARAMASGVSQATIPTMAGMVVAICGIFFSFRIEHSIKTETRKLSDLLIHEVKDEKIN